MKNLDIKIMVTMFAWYALRWRSIIVTWHHQAVRALRQTCSREASTARGGAVNGRTVERCASKIKRNKRCV